MVVTESKSSKRVKPLVLGFTRRCLQLVLVLVPVELLDSVGRSLPDVRGQVGSGLLDGQHHDGDDDVHADAGQNPQRTGPDELVRVLPKKR